MKKAINIVIPMAGEGRRFKDAGYALPKPFIDVHGVPMIERVIQNLALPDANYILIARSEHLRAQPGVVNSLREKYGCVFVAVDQLTQGSACTVLFGRREFSNDLPLFIANSDQLVDGGLAEMYRDAQQRQLDGSIMTFTEPGRDPKWSYVRLNDRGFVVETKEKVALSSLATVGIYYFKRGAAYVDAALEMFIRNDRTNGEFYTCPTYNYLIADGGLVGSFEVAAAAMHGIGTPADLTAFLESSREMRHPPRGT